MIGLVAFSFFSVISSVAYYIYAGKFIDVIVYSLDETAALTTIAIPFLIYILLLLSSSIFEKFRNYFEVLYNNMITLIIDEYKYEKNLALDTQTYLSPAFTAKKQILEQNGWKAVAAPKNIIELVFALLPVALYLIILFTYDWRISVLVLLSAIPLVYSNTKAGKRIWAIWEDNSDITAHYNMYRNALWGNITDVKLLGAGTYILRKLSLVLSQFLQKIQDSEKKLLNNLLLSTLIEYGLLAVAYGLLFQGILSGSISIGAFFVVNAALWTMKRQLDHALERYAQLAADLEIVKVFVNFLGLKPIITEIPEARELRTNEPISIEFQNVWFRYPRSKTWIFKGVSFHIRADEDIAIVGKNGAGKTTLIRLMTRMYDPQKGRILINGVPLAEIKLTSYHKAIGLLSQDFRVFEFSAKENIYLGKVTESKNLLRKIKKASQLAGATEVINKLPRKFDTLLTSKIEGGQDLSGGQFQRIAIARTFFRNPKLLILDEPTSAVDALAEEEIFNNIFNNAEQKTVIIVSHRFKTIRRAKRILVVADGKIVQDGTHAELLKQSGLYQEMYKAQE